MAQRPKRKTPTTKTTKCRHLGTDGNWSRSSSSWPHTRMRAWPRLDHVTPFSRRHSTNFQTKPGLNWQTTLFFLAFLPWLGFCNSKSTPSHRSPYYDLSLLLVTDNVSTGWLGLSVCLSVFPRGRSLSWFLGDQRAQTIRTGRSLHCSFWS